MNERLIATVMLLMFCGGRFNAVAVDYESDIKPLLRKHCVACHGSVHREAELRLDAGTLILDGGSQRVVVPGSSQKSELILRVTADDQHQRMPPEGPPLAANEIELLRKWIDAGAEIPRNEPFARSPQEHWAFQAVRRPTVPNVGAAHREWVRNPIDHFILAQLETQGSEPPPRADDSVLLRRVYLDVIGIPPSLQEQERYKRNGDLNAEIRELLARPEYGERWARHWLDVVRYADSNGYERDAEKPFVWRYRDYVIESLNADKPYDRFLTEQIAGDELPDRNLASHIATGFLRLGHWNDEPADVETDRYDQLDDIVSTVGQAFLGMTIGCARCHDHKFEPITSKDYYSLVSIFSPLERPRNGRTEQTVTVAETEVYAWREPSAEPPATHLLVRGSPSNPGQRIEPAVPAILVASQPEFPSPDATTSRRRLGLSRWLTDPQNPLTARVIVNRVWQQHFGQGIVTTASDFGVMGAAPTHPELLDWLADWFVHDADWSLKRLHHLILTSNAWQSVKTTDSLNRYRRLEVEAIRDSMLFVSGRLNQQPFGPAVKPPIPSAAIEANTDKQQVWQVSEPEAASRRSIYVFIKRGLVVPLFAALDLADTVTSCPQRQITTVAPQALSLFNGELTTDLSAQFASRVRRLAGEDPSQQTELAWRLALCRPPTKTELSRSVAFLKDESLEQLCRVIFNLNEFVYPE